MTRIILTWRYFLTVTVTLLVLVASYWLLNSLVFSLDSASFSAWIDQFGAAAPLVMVLLIAAEVIIAPLPGGWLAIATGYLFGSGIGFIYAYLGNIIGGTIAFELSRALGQPFVHRFVNDEAYHRYSAKLSTSLFGIGLLYAIPLFPVDIINMLLGITAISRKHFYTVMLLGLLPNMLVLNFVGAGIAAPSYRFVMISLVAVALGYFVWRHLFRPQRLPTTQTR